MGPIYAINFGFMNKISYLFDDHFMKVNKFTNVTVKKVLPSKEINRLKPSICFVLAIEHLKNIVLKKRTIFKRRRKICFCISKGSRNRL